MGSAASAVTVTDNAGSNYNPLQTAIPSLSIEPDAVGGGLGDVGAATIPDNNSQHWNPAKYALADIAQTNPSDRTLRFSLGFDLGGIKTLFGAKDAEAESVE